MTKNRFDTCPQNGGTYGEGKRMKLTVVESFKFVYLTGTGKVKYHGITCTRVSCNCIFFHAKIEKKIPTTDMMFYDAMLLEFLSF